MASRLGRVGLLILALSLVVVPGCARRGRVPVGVNMPPPDRPRLWVPTYGMGATNTLRPSLPPPRIETSASKPAPPVVSSVTPSRVSSTGSPFDKATAYRLRPSDPVIIFLRGILPKDDQIEDIIDESGYVKLPYLDNILAAGKTTSQLENEIQRLYIDRQIYKNITVNVVMPSQSYFVRGEVRAPGRFIMIAGITLLQAIASAGGYTDYADRTNVKITRGGKTTRYNIRDIERHPEKDVPLEPGDVIVIERSLF